MIGYLVQQGDRVTINVSKEDRDHGYNPCSNGTVAEVIGPTETPWGRVNNCGMGPGVFENRAWIELRMPDGSVLKESGTRLTFVEPGLKETRKATWIAAGKSTGARLRDLPDTPFWEGDVVRVPGRSRAYASRKIDPRLATPYDYVVMHIDYAMLATQRNDGSPWPAYAISDGMSTGWSTSVEAERAILVERGNVWKRAHGIPIAFKDLTEEAQFAEMVGDTKEVPNPATNRFDWTLNEALAAIRDGVAHGMNGDPMLAMRGDSTSRISVRRFRDEALGARVAAATLEWFQEPATT